MGWVIVMWMCNYSFNASQQCADVVMDSRVFVTEKACKDEIVNQQWIAARCVDPATVGEGYEYNAKN